MKLPNNVYDILKWGTSMLLPALATMYLALSELWNLPYGSEVSSTLMIVVVFLSTVLELSKTQFNKDFTIYQFPKNEMVTKPGTELK